MSNRDTLSKETILKAFQALSDDLAERNVMVLAYSARLATKDVDAIFQPTQVIRQSAGKVAETLALPQDWLNDGVKGYLSSKHSTVEGGLPQFANLKLVMPPAEYMLAMKCMASRIDTTNPDEGDVQDIVFLITHLNLKSARAVMEIVASYYPPTRIPVKAQYLVESLFEEGRI